MSSFRSRDFRENLRILEELGGRSGADTFVISDWGSYENINPMLNTALGSLFICAVFGNPLTVWMISSLKFRC